MAIFKQIILKLCFFFGVFFFFLFLELNRPNLFWTNFFSERYFKGKRNLFFD